MPRASNACVKGAAMFRPVVFNEEVCKGCNNCVDVCLMEILQENPEKGKPPMQAAMEAWRAGFWPCPAVRIWPRTTSETCGPSTPARLSVSSMATFPNW